MKRYLALTSSALTGLLVASVGVLAAPPGVIQQYNTLCDWRAPTHCVALDANGAIIVTGAGGGAGVTATAASPSYVEGATNQPLSSDLSGNLRTVEQNSAAILTGVTGSIPAGAALIGKVGIDPTAGQNGVVVSSGTLTAVTAVTSITNPVTAVGAAADAAATSGNPVPAGAVFETAPPTYTAGQRSTLHTGTRGGLWTQLMTPDGLTAVSVGGSGDALANTLVSIYAKSNELLFNGSTWDRAFTCPNTAIVNVTAAATTELVALTAAQVIRVCSFVLTESLAGTAKFVYGTGTNCGTGTTDITGAMALPTGGNLQLSAPSGGSLLRTIAANALCLTAVTGNITGFVTYAKY